MSSHELTFIDKALCGDALLSEIDDFIDQWHEGESEAELHEFLGMTVSEYDLWLSEPSSLAYIVKARHDSSSLESVIRGALNDNNSQQSFRIAARTDDPGKVDRLQKWLVRSGIDLT